ncbi:MAG: hypothetical protein ACHQ49_00740 [Elusimicrobiota bacterium]
MSENYYSPIPLTFLRQCLRLEALDKAPLWLVRDGLVPILWFFRTFPRPGKLKTRLLIHADFARAVPAAWLSRVGSYEIVSLAANRPAGGRGRRFIVAGPLGEWICSINALTSRLEKLRSEIGTSLLGSAEVTLYLPARLGAYQSAESDYYHAACVHRLLETFGGRKSNVRFIDWTRLISADAIDGDLVEFNDRLLCADNFLVHHILSKGGRLAGQEGSSPANRRGEIFPLSPYHGFLLNSSLRRSGSRVDFEFCKRALDSAANRSQSWHVWTQPRA